MLFRILVTGILYPTSPQSVHARLGISKWFDDSGPDRNSEDLFRGLYVKRDMKHILLSSMQYHRGILTDKIPVQGVPGALLVAVMLVTILGTPAARQFFFVTGVVGVVWAAVAYWWHNQTRW